MNFTLQCPKCRYVFRISHTDLGDVSAIRCRACGDTPAPDIMTAYANVGKSLSELYGCYKDSRSEWLPREAE